MAFAQKMLTALRQ